MYILYIKTHLVRKMRECVHKFEQITNLHNHQWEIKATDKSLAMQQQEMYNETSKQTPKTKNKKKEKQNETNINK